MGDTRPDGSPKTAGEARMLLNDISVGGVGFRCDCQFEAGQEVAIHLTAPDSIYLKGTIAWCRPVERRLAVISSQPYKFEVGVVFKFADDAEREAVKKYCDALGVALRAA